jgi:hypothetical protein
MVYGGLEHHGLPKKWYIDIALAFELSRTISINIQKRPHSSTKEV